MTAAKNEPAAPAKPTTTPVTPEKAPATPPSTSAGATPVVLEKVAVVASPAAPTATPEKNDQPIAGSPKVGSEPGTEAEDEFEKALNEPDVVPTPTDADLDKRDVEDMGTTLEKMHNKYEAEYAPVRDALREVAVLVLDAVGPDTKDSYVVWGYGGKQVNLGQLRTISRYFRTNDIE